MSLRLKIIVIASLVSLPVGGALAYWYFLVRGPFAGETTHDFGTVLADDDHLQLLHTFELTNRSDRPITINAVKPNCGCVTLGNNLRTVAPGEVWKLPISMRTPTGPKGVLIQVSYDDSKFLSLKVKADGRMPSQLLANLQVVALDAGQDVTVTVSANRYDSYDQPAAPTVTCPPGVTATFGGWKLEWKPRDIRTVPMQWKGQLVVKQTAEQIASDAAVRLEVPNLPALTIPITGQDVDQPSVPPLLERSGGFTNRPAPPTMPNPPGSIPAGH